MNVEYFSVEESVPHSTMCIEPEPEGFEASQSRFSVCVCVCVYILTHVCAYTSYVCTRM